MLHDQAHLTHAIRLGHLDKMYEEYQAARARE